MALTEFFETLSRYREDMIGKMGAADADELLELLSALIKRLPHHNLLKATREEVKAAGKVLASEGSSGDKLRRMQPVLVGLLDSMVDAGVVSEHPIRSSSRRRRAEDNDITGVLSIGFIDAQVTKLRTILSRDDMDFFSAPSALEGLERIAWFPFRLVICRFPCPKMEMTDALAAIRSEGSLCRNAGVVLLSSADNLDEAAAFIGRGVNRVITFNNLSADLAQVLKELEEVPQRYNLRVMVRAVLPKQRHTELWQTENISSSGMLVRCSKKPPEGSELDVELTLPGAGVPIKARAEIVRGTIASYERLVGVGIRFLSFVGEDQFRYESFLQQQR